MKNHPTNTGRLRGILAGAFLLLGAPLLEARAAEYFVKTDGNDSAGGTTMESAWASLQKAVNRLRPGDTLTIAPGEYLQPFVVRHDATADRPITIRAAIPGFSVIRGSIPIRDFAKVEGSRFLWSAPCDRRVWRVVEADTRTALLQAPGAIDMDQFRRSYLYDDLQRRLTIHTSDGQPPSTHALLATVVAGHGIEVTGQYVRLEGLTVLGFFPRGPQEGGRGFGLHLSGRGHEVRGCTFLYNGGGICVKADACVLRDNLLIGNDDPGHGEVAQIYVAGHSRGVETLDNIVLDAPCYGIRYYGRPDGAVITGNIVKGVRIGLSLKASFGRRVVQRNVVAECSTANFMTGEESDPLVEDANTFSQPSLWSRRNQPEPGAATLRFDPARQDPHFADPDQLDYRLQADSPFRDAATGKSLGAYPFEPNVYYVSPAGRDEADGLSVATAFRTLARAGRAMRPGVTATLLPGRYDEKLLIPLSGTGESPIVVRGRGRSPAAAVTGLDLADRTDLRVENLRIAGEAAIRGCSNVRIERCVVAGAAGPGVTVENSRDVWLRRLTVRNAGGPAIHLKGDHSRLRITSSILHSSRQAALRSDRPCRGVLFSEYNDYLPAPGEPLAAAAGDRLADLAALRAATGADRYSFTGDPQWVAPETSAAIAGSSCCAGAGELSFNVGAGDVEPFSAPATIDEVKLRDLTPTSASLTWWTPHTSNAGWRQPRSWSEPFPANSEVRFGPRADALDRCVHSFGDLYHRVTLHGLAPGTEYFFKVVIPPAPRADSLYEPYGPIPAPPGWTAADSQVFAFRTPSESQWQPPRRTFHVSPRGRSSASGLEAGEPTTLTAAGDRVRAGDTVILADGLYEETFSPAASGAPGAPIVLRAAHAGRACLDGSGFLRPAAVALFWKDHVVIDGAVIRRFADKTYGSRAGCEATQVFLARCREVRIENCVLAGWGISSYGLGVVARGGDRLTLHNCVFTGFPHAVVGRQNGRVDLLNNTWYVPRITNFDLAGHVTVRNNLFFGQEAQKVFQFIPMVSAGRPAASDCNAYYFGPGNTVRYIGYGLARTNQTDMGGLQAVQRLGLDAHSFEAAIEDVRLRGPAPADILDARQLGPFGTAIARGLLVPTLEMFTPPAGSRLNDAGPPCGPIGARPVTGK